MAPYCSSSLTQSRLPAAHASHSGVLPSMLRASTCVCTDRRENIRHHRASSRVYHAFTVYQCTYLFSHLADALIQSHLHQIQMGGGGGLGILIGCLQAFSVDVRGQTQDLSALIHPQHPIATTLSCVTSALSSSSDSAGISILTIPRVGDPSSVCLLKVSLRVFMVRGRRVTWACKNFETLSEMSPVRRPPEAA